MDTKKTIIVSVLTTLATMFVVAVLIHLCHCGGGRCGKQSSCDRGGMYMQCAHGGGQGHCAAYASSCSKGSSCKGKSGCSKGSSCTGKSTCTKGKSCSAKTACSKDMDMEWTNENGDKVIKKVIKTE